MSQCRHTVHVKIKGNDFFYYWVQTSEIKNNLVIVHDVIYGMEYFFRVTKLHPNTWEFGDLETVTQ